MFREFLRNYRVKNNLTQKQMAQKCDTAQGYYSQVESGIKKPGFKTIRKLAKVMNVSEAFLRSLL